MLFMLSDIISDIEVKGNEYFFFLLIKHVRPRANLIFPSRKDRLYYQAERAISGGSRYVRLSRRVPLPLPLPFISGYWKM